MKKRLLKSLGILLCLFALNSKAQTYSAWGHAVYETNHMYDTVQNAYDSLKFEFTNTVPVAYGNPKLVIYYEGHFNYMEFYDEQTNYFDYQYFNGGCRAEDSLVFNLSPADINNWATYGPGNSIFFTAISDADMGSCDFSRVRMRLQYDFCVSGVPAQFATPSISNAFVCTSDAPYTLTGTPAGGTFSGQGVTGSLFNPSTLAPGAYMITYTALDAQACTTTGKLMIQVKSNPTVNNGNPVYACNASTVALSTPTAFGSVKWFTDAALTNSISAASTYITPNLSQNTTYYVAGLDKNYSLATSTLGDTNPVIIDVDNDAGDDHGGMAVTQNYIYYIGDDACVRYDLDLDPNSLTIVPIRIGMFSDLHTGHLWTLWNTTLNVGPEQYPNGDFTVNALRGMNDNLGFTNEYIYLSSPIVMSDGENAIFAGAGAMGIFSGHNNHWYMVDLDNGVVADFGYTENPNFYGSETWSDWGVLETSCTGMYSVLYRMGDDINGNYDPNIYRHNLNTGEMSVASTFSDLNDLASFTINPWNNRWYFHYEGSGQFGGNSETLGYADATATEAACPGSGYGCPTRVNVTVPANVTLSLPISNICLDNSPVGLTGGAPSGGMYSGVGVGTNTAGTVFYPALAGAGTYTIAYTRVDAASQCTDSAVQSIIVNGLPTVTAAASHTAICLNTGATVTLTAGGGATYEWSDGLGSSSDVSFSPIHDQTYTVKGTDANGCSREASVMVLVSNCTGINSINADAGLLIYPNPSNGEFTVSSNQAITLSIINELGQQVSVITLDSSNPEVKVNNLSNGVYFITGVNENGSVKQKIVIAK